MDNILYEILYIIDASIDEPAQKQIQDDVKKLITDAGGEILKESYWGKQTMAYPIAKRTEGIYISLEFRAPADIPKQIQIYDHTHAGLLRHLVLKVPKAKLMQERRDEEKRKRDLDQAEKARKAALAAEAKREMEAAMADGGSEGGSVPGVKSAEDQSAVSQSVAVDDDDADDDD